LFLIPLFAQEFAVKQLESSSRHQEWVKVQADEKEVTCFVVYPEIPEKAPVIIVIHENRGLSDWVRSFADQLAAQGYITVAPDLLSGFSPEISSTDDFASSDEARSAIYKLDPKQIENDLNAVQSYASCLPAGNGKTAIVGFCWGGTQAFRFATYNHKIEAALVFYGSAPTSEEEISQIAAPVYAFYAGNDERINAGIPETEQLMKNTGKKYDYVIYPGAGHGFMRQGDDPQGSAENKKARNEAWERMKKILAAI
jgi:carboxymethylenebutenolidase